jgi:hypothetical protein
MLDRLGSLNVMQHGIMASDSLLPDQLQQTGCNCSLQPFLQIMFCIMVIALNFFVFMLTLQEQRKAPRQQDESCFSTGAD